MGMYGRNQHNIVNQLFSNKIKSKIKKLNFGCGVEILLQKGWRQEDQLGEKHSSPGER